MDYGMEPDMKTINLLARGYSLSDCGNPEREDSTNIKGVSTDWMYYSPHAFLWADKIFIPNVDYKSMMDAEGGSDPLIHEAHQMIFKSFTEESLITTFDPTDYYHP